MEKNQEMKIITSAVTLMLLLGVMACNDIGLTSLTLSQGHLSPSFDPEVALYVVEVGYDVSEITLTATSSETGATLAVYSSRVVHTGNMTDSIPLRVGDNVISIYSQFEQRTDVIDVILKRGYPAGSSIERELSSAIDDLYLDQKPYLVGAAASVFTSDGRQWHGVRGLNDIRNSNMPLGLRAPIGAGSITKMFVAALALKLMEDTQYQFSVEDTISDWLASWQLPDPSIINPSITIEELLSHRSGLRDVSVSGIGDLLKMFLFEAATLIKIHDVPPQAKDFKYANINYIVAGVVLEKVLQQGEQEDTVGRAMSRLFFKPLNLRHTYLASDVMRVPGLAKGHYFDAANDLVAVFAGLDLFVLQRGNYAGSLATTAEDLGRFVEALFVKDSFGNSALLSAVSLDLMVPNAPWSGYGLGVYYNQDEIYHTGSSYISSGTFLFDRDAEVSYVGLYNQSDILMGPGYGMDIWDISNTIQMTFESLAQ